MLVNPFIVAAGGGGSLWDGLAAFWRFEEDGDSDRVDATGNGHNLSVAMGNAVGARTTGKHGFAMTAGSARNGSTFMVCGQTSGADEEIVFGGDRTVFFWAKVDSTIGQQVLFNSWTHSGNGIGAGLSYEGTNNGNGAAEKAILSWSGEVGAFPVSQTLATGWHLFVITYDDATGELRLRVDDGSWNSGVPYQKLSAGTGGVAFLHFQSKPTNGFDSGGVFGRVISESEADELWNGGAGLDYE
jgi:hypothetical protein